ncbi:M43 family zinc metalloprotease [Lunatibacter salilacus]|uniref:M43 family zinc metalloprotease n=1 Tax=Lunatibacter salilacus TaxID=2483804 RepID=UPI00131DB6AA|nr:M43 family zinc metalloprotease [Lunatibacter salilacus]
MLKSLNASCGILESVRKAVVLTAAIFLLFPFFPIGHSQTYFGINNSHQHDEKCASVFLEKQQEKELGIFGTREYFESWIQDKQSELSRLEKSSRKTDETVRQIPVVVHVIHTGTALGMEANIPDEQVFSQIETLNQDFRRLNLDAVNTPEEFLDVAADAKIEFVLARRDPDGMPTNGINRVEGPRDSYPLGFNAFISQLASWPPEDYLNIWVIPMQAPNIGYATFPISNELEGLDFPASTRQTDGVTIDYRYFGSGGNALPSVSGRTATHEVGHFFGLRHIWGDSNNCDVDDFVTDTPAQQSFTTNCTATPRISCGSRDMVENYMDYSPDNCMNIFTQGQVDRMNVVLQFSPRRNSLLFSNALNQPELLENDISVERILEPENYVCAPEVTPRIFVANKGSNQIQELEVAIRLNGNEVELRRFQLALNYGETTTLSFNPISIPTGNSNIFEVEVLSVNGTEDSDPLNNYKNSFPRHIEHISLPFVYSPADFNNWDIQNPDNSVTWEQISLPIDGTTESLIYLNAFNYNVQGEVDYFISPSFDLSEVDEAQLTFKLAYSPFDNELYQERLTVAVSVDCGNTFEVVDYLYSKRYESLATQPLTFSGFTPSSNDQFRRELVNLSAYSGLSDVRIAFISSNGFGNNLYLKDIAINESEIYRYDFRIERLLSPLPVTAGNQENEIIAVQNTGNLPIRRFPVDIMLNSREEDKETFVIEDFNLAPGEIIPISLPNTIRNGQNRMDYRIYEPNFDQNGGNESLLTRYFVQSDAEIQSPWRQNFNGLEAIGSWIRINPERNFTSWRQFPLAEGDQNVLGVASPESSLSYWLASPLFDLSETSEASLVFDWTAGGFEAGSPIALEVLVSRDGGVTGDVVWSKSGGELNPLGSGTMPSINNPDDFRSEFIDLSAYAGIEDEQLRLFLRLSDEGAAGASVYLNNLELFYSNEPFRVDPGLNNALIYPNPAEDRFQIVFNLDEFEDVQIEILTMSGKLAYDKTFENTLNQTYSFGTEFLPKGVYIVKITSGAVSATKRLIIK